jgi:hypothetical protein
MPEDILALKRLLVGKQITDISYDSRDGMITIEVGHRFALVPMMDVEGNGYGALQWIDMKSDAQGAIG